MKKVLIVTPIISGKGGTETVIKKVLSHYKESTKVSVSLLILGGSKNQDWLEGIDKKNVEICNIRSKIGRVLWYLVFLVKNRFDTLLIINTQLIHITHLFRKMFNRRMSIVSWIHFSLLNSGTVNLNYLKEADFHLAISTGIRDQMKNIGIKTNKIFVIFNPMDFHSTVEASIDKVTRFVYIGRIEFNHQKNLETLLNACSLLDVEPNKWQLDIIGDGVDLPKCKEYANKLKLDNNINWFGWVQNPWSRVKRVDSLILSSNYEGLPMVLLEAISRGIPCITSDCPTGPNDIIIPGVNGYLVEPNNSNDLCNKMKKIMRSGIGRQHIQDSIQKFYDESYFGRLDKFLLEK